MQIFLGLLGIVAAALLLKYREVIGSTMGEAEWMSKVGGVYNLVIITSVIIFFWSIAYMTGTMGILLRPLLWLIPGARNTAQDLSFE